MDLLRKKTSQIFHLALNKTKSNQPQTMEELKNKNTNKKLNIRFLSFPDKSKVTPGIEVSQSKRPLQSTQFFKTTLLMNPHLAQIKTGESIFFSEPDLCSATDGFEGRFGG